MFIPRILFVTISLSHLAWALVAGNECSNTISPYLINVSHSQIDLLWSKAHRATAYCLCHGSVRRVGHTVDFADCDGGPRWACRQSREPQPFVRAPVEPATEYIFCARRKCGEVYSRDAECSKAMSATKGGWKFTVDLIEPNRALVLWTLPGAMPERHYEVTWCFWTGSLGTCMNKSSGVGGVVISHLEAWIVYDIAVVDQTRADRLLFRTRVRTRPQMPSEPQGFHAVQLGRGEARLSWSPPADPRGPVDAYDVTWCSSSCSTLAVSRLARHVVLSDVQASTHYKFRVRAKNVLDGISFEGPEAHLAALTPPEGVVFYLNTSDWQSVRLSWTSPSLPSDAWTIKHCSVDVGLCEKWLMRGSEQIIASKNPWTVFSVEVTDASDKVLLYTTYRSPPGFPSAPQEAKVLPFNSSALTLTWASPKETRGPVDGYLVKWHTFYEDGELLRVGSRMLRSLVIADVEELNTYTIEVSAYHLWAGVLLAGNESVVYGISYSSG
ncbi:unnamed protein product, partial [Ixodes pacificus]